MVNSQNTVSSQIQTNSSSQSKLKLGADLETFLKLLVTQLRNQDPLSPLKSHEFTNQLVMFAGVEQQIRGNELNEQLVEAENRRALTDGLNLIDKRVSYGQDLLEFDEKGQLFFEFTSPSNMREVRLQVYDEQNNFVTQLSTGVVRSGRATHIWDGRVLSASGAEIRKLDRGSFRLKVLDGTGDDGRVVPGSSFAVDSVLSGVVKGISIKDGQVSAELQDGKVVRVADVSVVNKDTTTTQKTSLDVASDLNRASSLIGRTVVYRSSTIPLASGKAEFSYTVPGAANTGAVYVTNLEGRLMYVDNLPLVTSTEARKAGTYQWDGTAYQYNSEGKQEFQKDAAGDDTSIPILGTAPDGEYIFHVNGLKSTGIEGAEDVSYRASDVEYNLPVREGLVTGAEILEGRSVVLKIGAVPVLLEGLIRIQDGATPPTPTPPSSPPSPSLFPSFSSLSSL